MSVSNVGEQQSTRLSTLPGDDVRQIMWRFADRFDLQMLVQSTRAVARGPVAQVVAEGGRNTHEWTDAKDGLLNVFDDAGITSAFVDIEHGGYIEGPKNFALALAAFELSWVDGGAATGSLAGNLALSPIHERGTPEQRAQYMGGAVPPQPGEDRKHYRGAFALTEPLPFVGVDTGVLAGRVRVAEWNDGEEPMLHVEKRGRFITNMAFANFVSAAVDTDDERIKSSCMIILEDDDEGLFDRGVPTQKLVHQLSSTRDPVFSLKVPAHRIIGGYTIQDGAIVPNFNHGQVIDAVFKRTRVAVGVMTSAKLLSAVEPVIRYQRGRFRGGATDPGSPRHDLGLQMKEDVVHRLVDIWATGDAATSFGMATARLFDDFDPLEREKDAYLESEGIAGGRQQLRLFRSKENDALEYVKLSAQPESERDQARLDELKGDLLVRYLVTDALVNVLCPATKLWNTGHGANVMREAVSLMGGYGITEDCPGFLGQKWMDAQLEATYEGPESVQRRQLGVTMTNEVFLAQFQGWITDMRVIASQRPGTGACALGTAMTLWLWTLRHLLQATDAEGNPLYKDQRQGVTFAMADALCWILASRQFILDIIELDEQGAANPVLADALPGYVQFYTDLAHVQVARAAGEVGRVCAGLVYGYNQHPSWDGGGGNCITREDLINVESLIPGIANTISYDPDVVSEDGSHMPKAGPCVDFRGMDTFERMRRKLDGCTTGSALAKDRASKDLTNVMIPEALDYPA